MRTRNRLLKMAKLSLACLLAANLTEMTGRSQTGLQESTIEKMLAAISTNEADSDRESLLTIARSVAGAQMSVSAARSWEAAFLSFLRAPASLASKKFICEQLSLIGSERSVPGLVALLADPKTADMGLFTLERLPGKEVERALRDCLSRGSGHQRGLVLVLGRRRDPEAVPLLAKALQGGDPGLAESAAWALGRIDDSAATDALRRALPRSSGLVRHAVIDACLSCAEGSVARGEKKVASDIYRSLYGKAFPSAVRSRALRGLAATDATSARPELIRALRSDDSRLARAAVTLLAAFPEGNGIGDLLDALPRLPDQRKLWVLSVLAESSQPPQVLKTYKYCAGPRTLSCERLFGRPWPCLEMSRSCL
jgi:HEAT repeat protein